jgi:hypothetical protein
VAVIPASGTYAVSGLIAVASGATNYLPPFFFHVTSGVTVKLVSVRAVVRSATSATISVNQNGASVSGLSAVVVTTTPTTTAATTPPSVADGDEFAIVVSSITGTPDGLTLTFFFEITT